MSKREGKIKLYYNGKSSDVPKRQRHKTISIRVNELEAARFEYLAQHFSRNQSDAVRWLVNQVYFDIIASKYKPAQQEESTDD